MANVFMVICQQGDRGDYVPATSKVFQKRWQAEDYLFTVSPAREPKILAVPAPTEAVALMWPLPGLDPETENHHG